MSLRSKLIVAGFLSAALAGPAAGRDLRLFLSTIGLTDPEDVGSSAEDPSPEFGINPHRTVLPNQPVRFYVWAKLEPAGAPDNVTFNGLSLKTEVTGAGGTVTGFNFWNYTNGSYRRWQQFSQTGDATSATYSGGAVVAGAGVNNTPAADNDVQFRRFASDGTTRIDSTVLGWIEFAGSAPGHLRIFMRIGPLGIAQSGGPSPRIYLGWGDEDIIVHGNDINAITPIPEATITVLPEPSSLLLLSLMGFALRRR